ncbi:MULTISPECIES: hypothetical protein [unclassified Microbacterium]|uniref:DUF7768 domain-containing protein n=1 Tax=unclassified Microbacterium TaxID=2609290 RepID=UPI00288339B1|nr:MULTISPECIES: hypothetical protein [unclassified Microbacterium]
MSTPTFIAPPTLSDVAIRGAAMIAAAAEAEAPHLTRVAIESPYSTGSSTGAKYNQLYGRAALRDSLLRGEAPMASHLLYTQTFVLDEADATEQALGVAAGQSWFPLVESIVVYTDRGITPAMQQSIDRAKALGIPVEERSLPEWQRG